MGRINRRLGTDDPDWLEVWQPHAEALFRQAGRELPELAAKLLALA